MFSVSVVDQIRLNFAHVMQNYSVHARAAERLSALIWKSRIVLALLAAGATATSIVSLYRPGREYQIATAAFAVATLAGYVLYVAIGPESRVQAHRSFAHRLWLVCERYRSLLADVQDGLVDESGILQRREMLSQQLHAVYEQGFAADQRAFESVRQLPADTDAHGTSDAQINRFLPASFRKAPDVPAREPSVQH